MSYQRRSIIGLLLVVLSCLAVVVAFSQQADKPVVDPEVYKGLMAEEVFTLETLAEVWADEAWSYIQVALPDATCWTQTKGPLPFDPAGFPKDFLENLIAYREGPSGVPVYEILIYQDRLNRDICFLNSDYKPIYVIECPDQETCAADAYALERYPDLYFGKYIEKEIEEIVAHLDPARVLLRVQLIPRDRFYDFLLDQARGSDAGEAAKEGGGDGMLLRFGEDYSNDLWLSIQGPEAGLTNLEIAAHLPAGFTNAIEIFTCTNLLDFWWTLAATNILTEGTDTVYWTYDLSGELSPVFFAAAAAGIDSDNDGLSTAFEHFCTHTDANNPDTDDDGFSDGDEVNVYGTDPLDKYSVPAPSLLTVSGSSIVDESGAPVLLKSVNIGSWLVLENWMVKYEPSTFVFTNYSLTAVINDLDESTLRQMLVQNVDYEIVLVATSANVKVSTTTETCTPKPSVGGLDPSDYIGFTNVDFGTGVSHLTAVVAVDNAYAGKWIDVRLDNPSNGALAGSIQVEGTGGWCSPGAQTLEGLTNCTGTHAVFFVGRGSAGGIGNLVSFRFWRDPNTTALLDTFRDHYFTTNDLDHLKALGYNCIRLPFGYDLIQDATGTHYPSNGWTRLDWAIDECKKRHMWCILDLHAAPGGQNGFDHSGQPLGLRNRLWNNPAAQDRLAHLWKTVAARYSNETTIAGYDLFNEPDATGGGSKTAIYSNSLLPLLDRVYKSIRSNDTQHLVFMESNFMYTNMWNDIWACPAPASKGWTNVVYEFHHYDRVGNWGGDVYDPQFETQKGIADQIVRTYTRFSEAKNVPVFIGEFMPVEMPNFDYFVRQFEANGIHWANWNYRHWGHDDSGHPWSSWGLDYRVGGVYNGVNTNIQPNVKSDSFEVLSNKLAQYIYTNYVAHPYLPKVVRNNAKNTNAASERTEFYLNTFSADISLSLADLNAWPWRKVAASGASSDRFQIQNQRARLRLDQGPLFLRAKSREEADARFEINDSIGCSFSVDAVAFNVTNNVAGYDSAVNLCAVRDEITARAYSYDTKGVIARLEYDATSNAVRVTVYGKNGGTNTYGAQLQQVSGIGFVGGATLQLFVNQTTATVSYNGTNLWNGSHGLNLSTWADGAVCVVEAGQVVTNTTQFADVDNIKAERPNATKGITFSDDFSGYATGIVARAEPEKTALRRWSTAASADSIMTNNSLLWIPEARTNGGSWYNPRLNYQNGARLDLAGTNIVEIQVSYDGFSSSNFQAEVALMPEDFPGEISAQFVGSALYLKITTNAGNLAFELRRHTGARTFQGVATNFAFGFTPGQVVSLQVSTNWCQVYYGTNLLINQIHGLTNAETVYSQGVYPHLELQNGFSATNLTGYLGDVLCRQRSTFGPP